MDMTGRTWIGFQKRRKGKQEVYNDNVLKNFLWCVVGSLVTNPFSFPILCILSVYSLSEA
jgi:hypothetical protein